MSRRTLITIAIGVLIAALMAALWWWFFAAGGAPTPSGGTFGTGGNRSAPTQEAPQGQTAANGTPINNAPTPLPSLADSASAGGLQIGGTPGGDWLAGGGLSGYGYQGSGLGVNGGVNSGTPNIGAYGGAGTSTGPLNLLSGAGSSFTPAQINQLNSNSVYGDLYIPGSFNSSGNNGSTNNGLAIGLVAGTAVACSAFLVQGQVAGLLPSFGVVKTTDTTDSSKKFMDCLMRTIARAALQQMTNSIVQWINSGFNGSPSFVTNYQQFFASVADNAAGNYIANVANFAPYCTPFRLQIRIALARSYARNQAPSCSLSTLLGTNTQGLFSGKTNGWSNLLQFTTVPSNNPYGSFMSAQLGLDTNIRLANTNAQRNMTQSGFLNFQQPYDCKNPANNGGGGASAGIGGQTVGYQCPDGCKCRVATPGSVIESSLTKTLGESGDYLREAGISGSFDTILNALVTQLMQRALYNGLSNAVPTYSYGQTPDQQTAQAQGQYLLSQLQSLVSVAQQYGQSKQGAIQDIEASQQQLATLYDCWKGKGSDTNADAASTTLHSFDAQIASLNTDITHANAAIATLQSLQTEALTISSTADAAAVQSRFDAAQAQGQFATQNDLTQAQQDRTTLQTQLSALNATTQSGLQQCNAS